ncbi:hypothetical protein DIURU_000626 [Diutina rugosa]|uniref:Initiator tRNA phosphoribosyl transferase n=1 Tax=Diutina rugosa TaxID=5481 RepID=A0A642UXK5_DIURU|nr:uncharacterized protein DIURU_000626 [Diutina rugosa]KAA8907306.1 hypothetical protein DIURU_000626 [Diutina rugosa]
MYSVVSELRKESLSLRNRLQSVVYDSKYVASLELAVPLIANERCGLWYVPHPDGTCYFKSTDGHNEVWNFSQRRLNLQLFDHLKKSGGFAIVDSTRKGKLIPDALSKTIPIWIAVMNGLNPNVNDPKLITPTELISPSIHSQIESKIEPFIAGARDLIPDSTFDSILKPMYPMWIYPGKPIPTPPPDVYPVYLITSSKKVAATQRVTHEGTSWYYIQGSGDDHELWATDLPFLSPQVFWDVYPELIGESGYLDEYSDVELKEMITWIYERRAKRQQESLEADEASLVVTRVGDTGLGYAQITHNVAYTQLVKDHPDHQIVILSKYYRVLDVPEKSSVVQFTIDEGKKGAKQLRDLLPKLITELGSQVIVACDTGKDLSIGVILVLLAQRYTTDWIRLEQPPRINKDVIKQHLARIQGVNPSRNTLQSVNAYLM